MKVMLLNDRQIEKIHKASIQILEEIGVYIPHEKVIDLFLEAGANVDVDRKIIKIPEKLVSRCLKICGKQLVIISPNTKLTQELWGRRVVKILFSPTILQI